MAQGPAAAPQSAAGHGQRPLWPLDWRAKLQYAYLLRVPALIGITLIALPLFARWNLRQLLGNLFVVTPLNIFWTMLAAEMLVLGMLQASRVVLLNGNERFGICQGAKDTLRKKWLLLFQIFLVPMFVMLVFSDCQATTWTDAVIRLGVGLGGMVAALIVAFVVLWFAVLVSPRYPNPDKVPPLGSDEWPSRRFCVPAPVDSWLDWAYKQNLKSDDQRKEWAKKFATWPRSMSRGYLDPKTHLPYPGQLLGVGLLIASYVVYQVLGYLKHRDLGESFSLPAVAYVVVLLIVLNWLLSIASFYLDYFRTPLLAPALLFVASTNLYSFPYPVPDGLWLIIVLLVISVIVLSIASFFFVRLYRRRRLLIWLALALVACANLFFSSDHYYEVRPAAAFSTIAPSQVLSASFRLNPDKDHPKGRITVVATAGGGIQAAAWTARVLTGLQTEIPADSPNKSFANSIAAISSVSGGAVGTMFFLSRYQTDPNHEGFPPDDDLLQIIRNAETGALGDVAWAMVYPDFTRALMPFSKKPSHLLIDRGWALEQSWRRHGHLDARLGDWRSGVTEGFRPAAIFNSTIVESGEPLLLATNDFDPPKNSTFEFKTLPVLLPGHDLPVVTAVRLAASFPFVSPASRALLLSGQETAVNALALEGNSEYHVVDGGYYDNYGVVGLLEFLGQALNATPIDKRPDVLIIQIRSFPLGPTPPGKSEGWFFQGWAPLDALMDVRTTAQLLRDREALKNFGDLWRARKVNIRFATFEFPGSDAPLSWQMTQAQDDAIMRKWDESIQGQNQDWLVVKCFFHPHAKECPSLPKPQEIAPR
jgi:hypothetical protein